jgi:hypothetical protein
MMEGSDTAKYISIPDHKLSSVLDSHLEDFVKVYRIISDRKQKIIPKDDETIMKPLSNYLRGHHRQAKRRISKDSMNSKDLNEALAEVFENLNSQQSENSEETIDIHLEQLKKIMATRKDEMGHLDGLKKQLLDAKTRATTEEKQRAQDALQGFSTKFENMQLPPVKVLLNIDHIDLQKFGLLSNPLPYDEEEEEEVPLDQKFDALLSQIKNYQISRIDTGFKKVWFSDQTSKMIAVETPGVLEVDSENVKNSNGALEILRSSSAKSKILFTEEEQKILAKMNSRINYLKNPRFSRQIPQKNGEVSFESSIVENGKCKKLIF